VCTCGSLLCAGQATATPHPTARGELQAMTLDDAIKGTFGALLTALTGVAGWLATAVSTNKTELAAAKVKIAGLEAEAISLRAQLAAVDARQLTREDLRGAIEEALDRRDRQALERRGDWDRRLALEI